MKALTGETIHETTATQGFRGGKISGVKVSSSERTARYHTGLAGRNSIMSTYQYITVSTRSGKSWC